MEQSRRLSFVYSILRRALSTIPQLLTIDQLAERLGITVRHVRCLVAEKRVPHLKVGRLVRFDPDEIKEWLANRRRGEEGLT